MQTPNLPVIRAHRPAWNKGRIVGQKRPLKPKHVWQREDAAAATYLSFRAQRDVVL